MTERILDARGALAEADIVHLDGHFIDHKGRHTKDYVNMDAFHQNPVVACEIGRCLAFPFRGSETNIQTVVGFGEIGQALAHWTAYHLQIYAGSLRRDRAVTAAYLRREGASNASSFSVHPKWDISVKGKRILMVTDVIDTWPSALNIIERAIPILEEYGGTVHCVEAIVVLQSLLTDHIGDVPFHAHVTSFFETWESGKCLLCAQGVPIRKNVGRGTVQEGEHHVTVR
jgi:orotate phosphoribosyltransferase